MWLLFLALSAAGNAASNGRHRVSPNKQVWEQIRGNMERKKLAAASTLFQAPPVKPTAEFQSETPETGLALLKPKRAVKPGPKFLQYTGKHPVGRSSRPQTRPMRQRLSAVSENRVGGKSAAAIAKSIARQIAEMKSREEQRRLAKNDAAAQTQQKLVGMSSRDRKKVVDTVFRPVNWDHHRDSREEAEQRAVDQAGEDPFANLHANFADEVRKETKKGKLTLKKKVLPVAQEPIHSVEQDLQAKETQVLAAAGADTPNKADFVFDVNKDPYGGVNAMVKDAEQIAGTQSEEAQGEAKARGDAARAAKAARDKKVELMPGAGGHLQPPVPVREETLAEALNGVKEAANRREMDNTAQVLGEVWAKKTHDKKLNSELATEMRVNQVLERARAEKVVEIEDTEAGKQLDQIDQEWESRFPDTSEKQEIVAAQAASAFGPAMKATPVKAAPVKPHGPVSGWGILSNELRNNGILDA